jgi:ABC-type antimicrobial peptide transport system permease subunit
MNNLAIYRTKLRYTYTAFVRTMHHNLFLIIGFYGLLLTLIACILTPWLASNIDQLYPLKRFLMPAWFEQGDINHILGIDNTGKDIFKRLLWALQTSLAITLLITLYVILIGTVMSLWTVFCRPAAHIVLLSIQTITAIPPLLMMMILSLFSGNTLNNLMMVVGVSLLPRFIYNLYNMVNNELKKTYIIALRLDGLSIMNIMRYSVFPNILANFVSECIAIFTTCLLALTTLTFLNFGIESDYNELGVMMREMIAIMPINQWAFIAPGLAILCVILLLNFFDYGLQQARSYRD